MKLALYHHPDGAGPAPGHRVVYDLGRDEAHHGPAGMDGPALVWELSEYGGAGARLVADVQLDPEREWIMRCDRVDFPPGAVAYRHTHPGPGIRCVLRGTLTVEMEGRAQRLGPLGAWFEPGPEPVLVTAANEECALVRVMLLPAEWEGRRTIRYVDPADEAKPKLQRATILFDLPLEL